MKTKVCSRCKKRKRIGSFSLSRRTGHQAYCRTCANDLGRANYLENRERYYALARERERRLDELINGYKSQPCADCGESYPPYVMDFDHRDGSDKAAKVSTMRRRRMAFAKIIAEIEKCDVVCANCHRERTNQRNPARYTQRTTTCESRSGGRPAPRTRGRALKVPEGECCLALDPAVTA